MKLKNRTELKWQPWKWWQFAILIFTVITAYKIDTVQAFELLKYMIDHWLGS